LANMFIYIVRFGTLDWATIFLYDVKGIDQVSVAIFWTLMPLAGIPGGIVAGYLADRFWNGRCVPINVIYLVLLIFSIIGFYFYSGPDNILLTGISLLLIGFLIDGPQNLISGVQASRVTVKEAISGACGMTGFFGYVGATFSGVGLAYITESFGWMAMYGACALSAILCLLLVLMTYNKEKGL
jgi:sugar phosphate permease